MAVNAKEYYENVLKQAGVSDAKRQALITQLDDEEISKALANEQVVPRMRHDEFSREMDKLKTKEKQTTDYYAQLLTWKAEQDRLYAESTGVQPVVQNGEYLTKKDLDALDKRYQEELGRRDGTFVNLLQVGMELASQHVNEFHEKLDAKALRKLAEEKGLSLDQAYTEMVAPRRAEQQTQSFAAKLAAAKEEGAREFASKHKIPVDTSAREAEFGRLNFDHKTSAVQDYVPNSGQLSPTSTRNLRESFVEAYNTAPTGTSER